ncbi:tail assembly chaperone [Streptomyces phage OnionKnight]|nr:tail assembly chaperone [Streptomyces phage OnionKnight]
MTPGGRVRSSRPPGPPPHPQAETRHSRRDTTMTAGTDLLGGGGSVDLTDGTSVQLRYSFRALALLEARYGSVQNVQTAIDKTGQGAAFGPVIQLIGAGALGPGGFEPHYREHQDAKGERRISGDIVFRRRTDGADIADLLYPGAITRYVEAFQSAFHKALAALGNDDAPTGATIETVTSPGENSSTSPSVPSTSLPATSGT